MIGGLLAVMATVPACGPSQEDVAEMRKQQRLILAKLGEIEKKLDESGGRRAGGRPGARPQAAGPDASKVYDLPVGASAIRGPEDAPVTIVAFSDYECPFCARAEPLIHDVMKEFPAQVRFVYKHMPLVSIHPHAMGAAQAATAAGKQGKFWEMHDLLFANQRALQPESLKTYAKQIGLDLAKFEADMASPEVRAAVQADVQLARTAGVRGTPTLFVNGKLATNRSVDGFKEMIQPLLKGDKPAG